MKLYSHPVLKLRTKDRLHVSKEPGLISWISFLSVTSLGILVDYYMLPDYFIVHAGFLSMCLILSLNLMKTWDLIMDREENLGTLIHRSWYHVFSVRVPEENVERFLLSAITYVLVTSDSTIDIRRKNGSTTQIKSESSNYRLLKKLREEISIFLCLERIENIKKSENTFCEWDLDLWSSSSGVTDNQESDNEIQESNPVQQESQFQYGSNIKIITGVL